MERMVKAYLRHTGTRPGDRRRGRKKDTQDSGTGRTEAMEGLRGVRELEWPLRKAQ